MKKLNLSYTCWDFKTDLDKDELKISLRRDVDSEELADHLKKISLNIDSSLAKLSGNVLTLKFSTIPLFINEIRSNNKLVPYGYLRAFLWSEDKKVREKEYVTAIENLVAALCSLLVMKQAISFLKYTTNTELLNNLALQDAGGSVLRLLTDDKERNVYVLNNTDIFSKKRIRSDSIEIDGVREECEAASVTGRFRM